MAKDPIVRQGVIKHNLPSAVVRFSSKRHRQCDLSLRRTPVGVDPLESASNLELFISYLKLVEQLGENQVQSSLALNQHLCNLEVADRW